VSNIAADLQGMAVPVDVPVLHPQNYRQGDVEVIKASLQRFGQMRPIVVQKSTAHVVAGNHTLKAAVELGWTEIACVAVDLSNEEAEAYLVADNRASDKATNDDAALVSILERLMLAGKLEGTGYNPDDVDDMMSALDALPTVEPETEAQTAVTDEQLAERFANRSQVALRQFVVMYPQDVAGEFEQHVRRLERAWGMSQTRDVVLEALKRANDGLTNGEAAAAEVPPQVGDPQDPDTVPVPERDQAGPPVGEVAAQETLGDDPLRETEPRA
jgi:ParB-like chromosome segregation protein Spo0J